MQAVFSLVHSTLIRCCCGENLHTQYNSDYILKVYYLLLSCYIKGNCKS